MQPNQNTGKKTSNLFRYTIVTLLILIFTPLLSVSICYLSSCSLQSFGTNVEELMGYNTVTPHKPYEIDKKTAELHKSLTIADWHTDSLMWSRNLLKKSTVGQVDIPRLKKGNVAIQVFTSVTKVPASGIQLQNNSAKGDRIATLARADNWPIAAQSSLFERAVYHAQKLHDFEKEAPDQLKIVRTQEDLKAVLQERQAGSSLLGALLGTEGLHPLEGKLGNIERLASRGYRIMGLFHFFDNELGGSLHGISKGGLSDFGKKVIRELNAKHLIIDLAHASEASVKDVLELSNAPVIVSHTGMHGVCPSARNLPDNLMKKIAEKGGLIGIGYFRTAICKLTPQTVVKHIRYAIDLLGVEHVSLGSDYDGTVITPFDTSELAILTKLMIKNGFSQQEIKSVMGGNIVRFLSEQLPDQ